MAGKCPVCGAPLNEGICEYCGYSEKKEQAVESVVREKVVSSEGASDSQARETNVNVRVVRESAKSKVVALLLCIFFGVLGFHRFYVGKIGTGIIYLFTAGAFGIGWIIDIVSIATGSFTDNYGGVLK